MRWKETYAYQRKQTDLKNKSKAKPRIIKIEYNL